MKRTTRIKSTSILLLILIFAVNTASADVSIVNNTLFNLNNGAFITVLTPQNSTNITIYNSTNSPASTLQFYINGTPIRFSSTTNKTLSNISYKNVTDNVTYTGNGTNGYLNVSAKMKSASTLYNLIVDGIYSQAQGSNATGWVIFNYTGWSQTQHAFQISVPPNITSWSNNFTNNNSLLFDVPAYTSINFNITANQTVTYSWIYDNLDQNKNFNNFTQYFTTLGLHTINTTISNANGTSSKNWTVTVVPEIIDVTLSNTPVDFGNLTSGFSNKAASLPMNVTIQSTTNVNVNLTLNGTNFTSGIYSFNVSRLNYSNLS